MEIVAVPESVYHCRVVEELSPSITEVNFVDRTLKGTWDVPQRFCHTKGTIVHGGTLSFILDTSMFILLAALSDYKNSGLSLGLNLQFFNIGKPGRVEVQSQLEKEGRNIVFGRCVLYQDSETIASATQQIKVFESETRLNFDLFFSPAINYIR